MEDQLRDPGVEGLVLLPRGAPFLEGEAVDPNGAAYRGGMGRLCGLPAGTIANSLKGTSKRSRERSDGGRGAAQPPSMAGDGGRAGMSFYAVAGSPTAFSVAMRPKVMAIWMAVPLPG